MIAVIVHIKAKPDCVDRLLAACADNAEHSNQEPGCRKWEYSRRLDDPNHIALYEIYDDLDAFQAHTQTAHFQRWVETAPSLWESKESGKYEIL